MSYNPTDLSDSAVTVRRPASFDLTGLVKELNMAGQDIKEEDISLTPDSNLETPEKVTEYKKMAKDILKSKRKHPNVDIDKPAINLWARILIRYRIGS